MIAHENLELPQHHPVDEVRQVIVERVTVHLERVTLATLACLQHHHIGIEGQPQARTYVDPSPAHRSHPGAVPRGLGAQLAHQGLQLPDCGAALTRALREQPREMRIACMLGAGLKTPLAVAADGDQFVQGLDGLSVLHGCSAGQRARIQHAPCPCRLVMMGAQRRQPRLREGRPAQPNAIPAGTLSRLSALIVAIAARTRRAGGHNLHALYDLHASQPPRDGSTHAARGRPADARWSRT